MNRRPERERMLEEVRRRAPQEPGVYVFHGEGGAPLYVGKAVNLQQRLRSHLRANAAEDLPRHAQMVREACDFSVRATGSELLALLREDELIKTHRPPYNRRQNEFLEYVYVELTADEFPRLRVVEHEADFGTRRVFGPYRDRFLAGEILDLAHEQFGVRSCASPQPTDRCLEFDLGRCAGPCRGALPRGPYLAAVARAAAFLGGDVSAAEARLRRAMEAMSERLEFEKAQALKDRLAFCRRFGDRQRFFAAFRERTLTVVEGDIGLTFVFRKGGITVSGTAEESFDAPDDLRFLLDRATIVHNWLRRNAEVCRYSFGEG